MQKDGLVKHKTVDENKITFFLYRLLIKANKKITGICSQIVAFTSCIVLIKLHKFHSIKER